LSDAEWPAACCWRQRHGSISGQLEHGGKALWQLLTQMQISKTAYGVL
jgi:hypothetical protein